ncbi:MAG: VOC family protein [Loktanella sp.]|nr:VOC family protein [Loktanella sp.]
MIGVNDLGLMVAFYDAVLARVDLRRTTDLGQISPAGVIWQKDRQRWPQFAIREPINGDAAVAGNGVQISFQCSSQSSVQEAWKAALRHGGTDEGAPGDRPAYDDDFYAAYARDPEGNKLCFLFCTEFGTDK